MAHPAPGKDEGGRSRLCGPPPDGEHPRRRSDPSGGKRRVPSRHRGSVDRDAGHPLGLRLRDRRRRRFRSGRGRRSQPGRRRLRHQLRRASAPLRHHRRRAEAAHQRVDEPDHARRPGRRRRGLPWLRPHRRGREGRADQGCGLGGRAGLRHPGRPGAHRERWRARGRRPRPGQRPGRQAR